MREGIDLLVLPGQLYLYNMSVFVLFMIRKVNFNQKYVKLIFISFLQIEEGNVEYKVCIHLILYFVFAITLFNTMPPTFDIC